MSVMKAAHRKRILAILTNIHQNNNVCMVHIYGQKEEILLSLPYLRSA